MVKLFEFTKILFEHPGKWNQLTKAEKSKHFFMTSRFMSIAYPLQALVLNHSKINTAATLDFWQGFMRQRFKKTPFWMFIKGSVKKKEEKTKKAQVSDEIIAKFAKVHFMEIKSVNEALLFFPAETLKEIKKWQKVTA